MIWEMTAVKIASINETQSSAAQEEDVAIHLNSVLDKTHNVLSMIPVVVLSAHMIVVVMECVNLLILHLPLPKVFATVTLPTLDLIVQFLFVMCIILVVDAVLIPIVDGVAKLNNVLLVKVMDLLIQPPVLLVILG